MSGPESDPIDPELLERYRKASDAEAVAPTDAVRAAIIAEGRRVAEQVSNPRPGLDTTQPAANQSRWKLAAFGTVGVVLLTAVIVTPRLWEHPMPALKETHQPTLATNSAAPASQVEGLGSRAPASSPAPAPLATPQAPADSHVAETIVAERSAERALASAADQNRMAAAFQRRKADTDDYTPTPPTTAAHPDRQSSYVVGSETLSSAAAALSKPSAATASLQSAARSGDASAIAGQLDQGAALDSRDNLGRTPLMLATLSGQVESVRLLLSRGADPNIADNEGKTPLQMAQAAHLDDIAKLLESAGPR